MAESKNSSSGEHRLQSGQFFGAVRNRFENSAAVFTDLRHTVARKLPTHSHELPFFGLLLSGFYGERFGRQQKQFSPMSLLFRPAGIPHQDEIAPGGLRFFHIELRHSWKARMAECSGKLDQGFEDARGSQVFWLTMKLFREIFAPRADAPYERDSLCVENLLSEVVAIVACVPLEEKKQAPAWLNRVLEKLHAEHCRHLTLSELSAEAGVHPVHLSRVFRRFQREGIGEYTHRLRARTASRLLLDIEMPLAEISLLTGFADQSHFTRTFHKITGLTPLAFRSHLHRAF